MRPTKTHEEVSEQDATASSQEGDSGGPSQVMDDHSWDALTQLLTECAIDTGVPDLAQQHDHYLYGIIVPVELRLADSSGDAKLSRELIRERPGSWQD
ncbi:MAG: hypothetical protein ABI923_11490 [bacterium]